MEPLATFMTNYGKLISSVRLHAPYLAWAKEGRSPEDIKKEVFSVLHPHFENPSVLNNIPIAYLAHEAVTIGKIQEDAWASGVFTELLSHHRKALIRDQNACVMAVLAWNEPITRAMSEFISICLLEADKTELDLDEIRVELIRGLGGVLEACLQPQLKALLHTVRIGRGRKTQAPDILTLKFGVVVEELYQTLLRPDTVAPPPWGLKLHQWRNIAQHHSSKTEGTQVVCWYEVGTAKHQIRLTRDDLFAVAKKIQDVLGIVRSARTLFVLDNSTLFQGSNPTHLRPEIQFFQAVVGMATEGFEIVGIDVSGHTGRICVQDVTDLDPRMRAIHASQFLVLFWEYLRTPVVQITYIDKRGAKRLQATVAGKECEEIGEGRVPFETLADRVQFHVFDSANHTNP